MHVRRPVPVPAAAESVFAAFTEASQIRAWHVPGPDFAVCIAEVTVHHDLLPDEQSAEDHTRGWTGTLESLVTYFTRTD